MKASFRRWLPAIPQQTRDRTAAFGQTARRFGTQTRYGGRNAARQAAEGSADIARRVADQRVGGQRVGDVVARTDVRKGALLLAGLAFVGGIAAGPGTATHATATDHHAAAAPARAAAVPSLGQLIPYGTQGAQSTIPLSDQQFDNAKTIVDTAKKLGLPDRAAVIGVATSLQESKLNNYGNLGDGNDHDSLGLFQQRPSSGWGTPDQLTNPEYAATAFFNGLTRVDGWQQMPLSEAAQSVQVSAFPFAYAQWEQQAANVVQHVDRGH